MAQNLITRKPSSARITIPADSESGGSFVTRSASSSALLQLQRPEAVRYRWDRVFMVGIPLCVCGVLVLFLMKSHIERMESLTAAPPAGAAGSSR